jgi:carboxy-cis,cis-muconate cyclase
MSAAAQAGNYGGQTAVVSTKGTILWTTSRSRMAGKPGYLTGFKLGESGAVYEMLFQVETPTSGGKSNNVIACPWSENVVALTESEKGSLSIWRYGNGTVKQLVSADIQDTQRPGSGCCSDAVWLD